MVEVNPSQFLPMFKAEALDRLRHATDDLLALERDPKAPGRLDSCRREVHTVKGAAGMVERPDIAQRAHALEDLLGGMTQGQHPVTPAVIEQMLRELDQLRGMVEAIGQPSVSAPSATADGAEDLWRIPRARVEHLLMLAMELETSQARVRSWGRELDDAVRQLREFRHQLTHVMEELQVQAQMQDELRPLVERVAHHDREAERLRGRLRVLQETFEGTQAMQEGIVDELGQEARALRLVPCATIFDGLPRLARDLAVHQSKQVELIVRGADVGVDRRLVEEVKECVIHLVRNSVDHGLEPSDERERIGKPPSGTVQLDARHQGHLLLIDVTDDGRGVQPLLIARAAVARGLIAERQARQLTEAQLMQFIFTPGFSTAAQVTEVSGRGVGLDAVKRMVERLQGHLTLTSRVGQGTTVTLSVPLTVGLVPVLALHAGDVVLAAPLGSVQGSCRLAPAIIQPDPPARLQWKEQWLPVVDAHRLGTEQTLRTCPSEGTAVIVHSLGQVFALVVDRIIGERELCVQSLGPYVGPVPYLSGAGLLEEGGVALMLDVTQCGRVVQTGGSAS